jgi:hypothetical protein
MRTTRLAGSIVFFLVALAPVLAGVKVAREEATDFAAFHTYAWGAGTPAARPEIQDAIVAAVERELQAKGLRRVEEDADLLVSTVAFARMDVVTSGGYVHLDTIMVGVITHNTALDAAGHLMVDLLDPATNKPVWRAIAEETIREQDVANTAKIKKKVDKIVAKMFAQYPQP